MDFWEDIRLKLSEFLYCNTLQPVKRIYLQRVFRKLMAKKGNEAEAEAARVEPTTRGTSGMRVQRGEGEAQGRV